MVRRQPAGSRWGVEPSEPNCLVHKWSLKNAPDKAASIGRGHFARARAAAEREVGLKPGARILHAAAWANVVAFGLVALVGAAVAIPLRLGHPQFLYLYLVARRIASAFA